MSTASAPEPLRGLGDEELTARIVKQKVWRRCNKQNKHFMGAIVGREGSGKSYTALKIAASVDPTFDAERVFFDPERLLETLKSDAYGPGTAVVIDEAGVGVGSRTWYDREQIVFNQALQTARDDNMAVLFTLPRLSELDSQTRGRLHAFIEMTDLEPGDYALAKWKNIDPHRGEDTTIYKKYPRMRVNGRERRITRVRFTPPGEELAAGYEDRKEAFKDELYAEAIQEFEDAGGGDDRDAEAIAQEIAEDIDPYVSRNNSTKEPYINKDLIRVKYDISHSDASAVKALLEQAFTKEELEDHA